MKEFYLHHGEKHLRNGNLQRALTYFERYNIIEPDDVYVRTKLEEIRKRLDAGRAAAPKKKPSKKAEKPKVPETAADREEIESMLEESGKSGTWIMKYLFEDQEGEQEEQTPWD